MNQLAPPVFEHLNDYYQSYWKHLKETDLLAAIVKQGSDTMMWVSTLPEGSENLIYKQGKWMVKEVIGHLCDTERILSYRALCISRNEKANLPSFDENDYVNNGNFKSRTLNDIMNEWKTVRGATVSLFSSLTDEMADRKGSANTTPMTPRILLYFILVHERHHLQVIKERYLTSILSA